MDINGDYKILSQETPLIGKVSWFSVTIISSEKVNPDEIKLQLNPLDGSGLGPDFRPMQITETKKISDTHLEIQFSAIPVKSGEITLPKVDLQTLNGTISIFPSQEKLNVSKTLLQDQSKLEMVKNSIGKPFGIKFVPLPTSYYITVGLLGIVLVSAFAFILLKFLKRVSPKLIAKKATPHEELEKTLKEVEKNWKKDGSNNKTPAFQLSEAIKRALGRTLNLPISESTSNEVLRLVNKSPIVLRKTTKSNLSKQLSTFFGSVDPIKYTTTTSELDRYKSEALKTAKQIALVIKEQETPEQEVSHG